MVLRLLEEVVAEETPVVLVAGGVGAGGVMVRLTLVSLMGVDGMSHRSVCVRRRVVGAYLRLVGLLVQAMVPIIRLPLRVHAERVGR